MEVSVLLEISIYIFFLFVLTFCLDLSVAIAWANLKEEEPTMLPPSLRDNVTHITPDAYHNSNRNDVRSSFSVAAKGYCDPVWFIEKIEDEAFSNLVVSAVDDPTNVSCPSVLLRSEVLSCVY